MKKLLSLVLSVLMLLLAGTAALADDDMIMSVEAAGTKGDQITKVAYIPMSTTNDYFLAMCNVFTQMFNDAGFEAEYTSPDFDPVRQQEIFENYVAQGYDCIVVFPINAASLNTTVELARAQGIKVVCQVNQTDECDGWVGTDGFALGQGAAQLAADWVEKTFPDAANGDVKCAIVEVRTDDNNTEMADGCYEVSNLSSKIEVVTTISVPEETEAAAQQAIENLFITNPEVQVIIATTGTLAKGADAYLTAMNSPVEDASMVGIFTTGSDNAIFEAIKASQENTSVIRGISSYAPMLVGAQILTNIIINLSNGITGEVNFQADPQYLLSPENIDIYLAAH